MKIFDLDKNTNNEIYIFEEKTFDVVFNINEKIKVKIFQFSINKNGKVVINLNCKNSEIEYHYSTINRDDNNYEVIVNHNASETISNIYNHGINTTGSSLSFDVTGVVPKKYKKCVVNQENQIINLANGMATIMPKLLIDNYDVTSSHSAYIGKFKDDLIYYVMSRGIPEKKAIKLLMYSLLVNGADASNDTFKKMQTEIENL